MVSIKLKGKAQEQKSGFEPYDGPEPNKRGFYRAVIKKMQFGKKGSGSTGFFIVAELEADKGDPKGHAQFDGYPMFARNIITESADGGALKEGAQRNLENLLAALNTGDDPAMVLGKTGDIDAGTADVAKIGGKNPIGAVVNIDMDFETYNGERRPVVGGIYKFKASDVGKPSFTPDEDEDDESDLMEQGDSEEATEVEERAAELAEMSVTELRKLAKEEYDLKSSGSKDQVIERILEHEFPEDDEDDEDESEDESEDEPDEDESEDDEEDDESEDGEEAERREELEGFERTALKSVLKEVAPDFRILKRHSDAELVDAIIEAEFGDDTPF